MTKDKQVLIDCIPDVHFSRHIIPSVLTRLPKIQYDLVLIEGGLASAQGEGLYQKIIKENGTAEIYEKLRQAVKSEPICVDSLEHYFWASKLIEKIGRLVSKGKNRRDIWSNPRYRATINLVTQYLYPERDLRMLRQIRTILTVVSAKERRPVRILLVTGLAHAVVLRKQLNRWYLFRYLVSLKKAKTAIVENYKIVLKGRPAVGWLRELRDANSFEAIRGTVLRHGLISCGAPVSESKKIIDQVCPVDIEGPRIRRWYHPNGLLACEQALKGDQADGKTAWYSRRGILKATAKYKLGKRFPH